MRRASVLALAAVALGTAATVAVLATAPGSPAPPPHILLISVDTLRADALRAYDRTAPPLPAFDALAEVSLRFEQAISPAAWTLPAHASMFTGLYPHNHGAVHRRATLAPGVPTVAEHLAARGYETAGYSDGGFMDADYGLGRGFERYDGATTAGAPAPEWLPRGGRPPATRGVDPFGRAIAHLRHRDRERPLFLFVHTYAVHDYFYANPWTGGDGGGPPDAGADAAAGAVPDAGTVAAAGAPPADDGTPPARRPRNATMTRNLRCLTGDEPCPPEDWERLRQLYAGELRHLDGSLDRLLAAAREELGDRPLWVVLTSDHGEGFDLGAGASHHGGWLHPDVLTVPLLVAGPGVETRAVATPVSLVDLAPTLLDLAGAERLAGIDGRSLRPLFGEALRDALGRHALAGRTLRAEDHYYWWAEGRRRTARDVPQRPFGVAVTRNGWWYARGMGREEILPTGGNATGSAGSTTAEPPHATLAALRREAALALRERVVDTSSPVVDREREAQLQSLGYGGP